MWTANVFTMFPQSFPGALGVSIIGKALLDGMWNLNLIDLKKFPVKSDRIDSPPYGGGKGMILSPISFCNAFSTIPEEDKQYKTIYLSPRGIKPTQKIINSWSKLNGMNMICGRYEGIDQRILDAYNVEEVSIGDFVLLGGESAATTIIEACVRLLPNVVGNEESVMHDSFQNHLLEYNQYTNPRIFLEREVPSELLGGNHMQIEKMRTDESKLLTLKTRPDLWAKYVDYNMR